MQQGDALLLNIRCVAIAVFLLLPLSVSAQRFDFSLLGGITNTVVLRSGNPGYTSLSPRSSVLGGFTGFYLQRRSAIGISFSLYTTHSNATVWHNYPHRDSTVTNHEYYGRPSLDVNLILSTREETKHATVLVGGQLGVVINKSRIEPPQAGVHNFASSVGVGLGFYFHYIYHLNDHVGIGGQFTPRLTMLGGKDFQTQLIPVLTLPVALSVHMRL